MNNKIVTHFYVKEIKKDRKGEAPIYLLSFQRALN
jgi:hypothetical protein